MCDNTSGDPFNSILSHPVGIILCINHKSSIITHLATDLQWKPNGKNIDYVDINITDLEKKFWYSL